MKMRVSDKFFDQQVIDMGRVDSSLKVEETISRTFMWTGVTLLLAFGSAYGTYMALLKGMISYGAVSGLMILSAFGGLALVVAISFLWKKLTYGTLAMMLMVFGLLEGFGLTGVFLSYQIGYILQVFSITSILFLGLALVGSKTDINITKIGPILMVGLISLIVGSIVNMFLLSSGFDLFLGFVGVIIFSIMIVYDMNVLRKLAYVADDRVEIFMAVSMFLNFINLFLSLLRIIDRD